MSAKSCSRERKEFFFWRFVYMHWDGAAWKSAVYESYGLHEIPSGSFKLLMTFNVDSFKGLGSDNCNKKDHHLSPMRKADCAHMLN